jgi:NAD(P)-dependent dehydrogenase (short-subunit alcohol dehydrogenase family)
LNEGKFRLAENNVLGRMSGRRALVTGAASGIGAAIARLFAKEGAKVALLDRVKDTLLAVAAELSAVPVLADLTNADETAAAIDTAAKALGGLDCVVNAAGVLAMAPFDQMETNDWARQLAVNLTGPFLVCRTAVQHLRKAPTGTIVNISSGIAIRPIANYAGYAASKAGLLALTKVLAQELAPSIRVNAVCPGPVETPLIRDVYPDAESRRKATELYALRRFGKPDEIAATVLFLSSFESSYITGVSLPVDGGRCFY